MIFLGLRQFMLKYIVVVKENISKDNFYKSTALTLDKCTLLNNHVSI